jgi:hypothetical protein
VAQLRHKPSQVPSTMEIIDANALLEISPDFDDHRTKRSSCWYWARDEDGYMSGLPFVSALFRGQNQLFSPMLPSISRGLQSDSGELCKRSATDQAKIILRFAQAQWFGRELDYHPITSHAAAQKLKLDRIALAQHYGIATQYLDLQTISTLAHFCHLQGNRTWLGAGRERHRHQLPGGTQNPRQSIW